jgi:hypothetical protein
LIKQALAALRARAVYLALHLGDHQSKVLDQGFRTKHFCAHLDESRLQRLIVFRKVIIRRRHDVIRSQSPVIRSPHVAISTVNSALHASYQSRDYAQPAADGRQL